MRSLVGVILIFFLTTNTILANEIVVSGIYQGENLFVMNPFASTGVGFCVYEVTVNGQISTDEINSSAFEIDLSVFQLKTGDKVKVVIKHKDGCKPKVLNKEVLLPKSTFKVLEIRVDRQSNQLKWSASSEKGPIPFVVEQYKWKKWVKVGTVKGKGSEGPNHYSIKIEPHTGLNKFRVKQIDYSKKPRYSPEATYRSLAPEVKFSPEKPKDKITFTAQTAYEIYDFYGRLVKKGNGKSVDVSKLKKGDYFLNFDNTMGRFSKK